MAGVQVPLHLREDFCGTALVCVTWCKQDVFHSAVGLDLDPEPLQWGMRYNAALLGGNAPSQLCLLQCNVRVASGRSSLLGQTGLLGTAFESGLLK